MAEGALSEEQFALFEEGIRPTFRTWDMVTTAVNEQWGGDDSEEKAEWLCGLVIEKFQKKRAGWYTSTA